VVLVVLQWTALALLYCETSCDIGTMDLLAHMNLWVVAGMSILVPAWGLLFPACVPRQIIAVAAAVDMITWHHALLIRWRVVQQWQALMERPRQSDDVYIVFD
jgi:hypothetical protein